MATTPALKRAIISPSSGIVSEPGYDFSLFTTSDLNAPTSVPAQAAQQGDVILWSGFTKSIGFSNFPAMLAEVAPFPNIKYAYIYDEMFWNGTGIQIGLDEASINTASDQAHAAGLQTVVTILPDVILDPAFALTAINKYDVIAVDVYPLIRPTSTVGNYPSLYPNVLSDLLYSSLQRLRQLGFTGRVWYIYQAFGMHSVSDANITAAFDLQIETLNACGAMGIEGIVPFGFWLGPTEIAAEPDLFQGYGTAYEIQLRYPPVVVTPILDATFSLTSAGILAASNATPTGPAIKIVAFKLGDNADQPPSQSDTDLVGNTVYSGVPASFSFYDEQTIQINMEVPATAGPFMFGELGLYLENDVLFARFSYGQLQIKTASPTGAIANALRINALMRIAQGGSSFHILPGTAQSVIEMSNFSLVNTPTSYPENPVILVHEPNDFQESALVYRAEATLWNLANYSRIGTATITAADDVFHLTADYFGTLYLPPNNLGRFVIQAAGGFLRTITAFNVRVATLAQQMDTASLVGQTVAVYELNAAAFADLYASVGQLQAAATNARLYLGLTSLTGNDYTSAPAVTVPPPDIFSLTFMQSSPANATLTVGVTGPYPLLDAEGNPVSTGLLALGETRTVIFANNTYIVQDVASASVSGVSSVNTRTGDVVLTSADVGLDQVNNTADSAKPVSTAQQTAINTAQSNAISAASTDATSKANAAQAAAILASVSKAGDTMTGDLTMSGHAVVSPLLKGTRELRAAAAIAGGVLPIDLTNSVSVVALNANITSITFANNNASATACMSHHIEFTGDGTQRTALWPSGDGVTTLKVVFPSGTPPTLTLTAGKRDTIGLKSVTQFLWDAFVIGQNS